MNTQEREALQDFIHELSQARVKNKDQEADAIIAQAIKNQPDAPYLLVQRLLLQEQALNAAQDQIRALQQQLHGLRQGRSDRFLGDDAQWGRNGTAFTGTDPYDRPMGGRFYSPMARPGLMSSGMGSFLGSMAGVAAGVAAGSFLFHGIDHLLHHGDNDGESQQQDLAATPTDEAFADPVSSEDTSGGQDFSQDVNIDDPGMWSDDPGGANGDII